jgi:hypothetical protein
MLSIAIVIFILMHNFIERSSLCSNSVSGRHCVSMVLISCLHADTPYIPDRMVDRMCDNNHVESFIVHLSFVGQVEPDCYGRLALLLIFLSNVHY